MRFDDFLERQQEREALSVTLALKALTADTFEALAQLNVIDRGLRIFWLLGPFVLLIERTPADIWLSSLSIAFLIRCMFKRDLDWLKATWVQAGLLFWLWCIISSSFSQDPVHAVIEAIVWFRFPLFAIATVFWLADDKRILYGMLVSTAIGLILMTSILACEIVIVGQQDGRLNWPYGDAVPGSYVAKVCLPVFTIMVALAVSMKGRVGNIAAVFSFITIIISVLTGERINFLIRACGGILAGFLWKPRLNRFVCLLVCEIAVVTMLFVSLPSVMTRYINEFFGSLSSLEGSQHLQTLNAGFQIALDNLTMGIGTGNYAKLSIEVFEEIPDAVMQPHPHNFYLQMLVETGVIGLFLGSVFLGSIVWGCFKASLRNRENVWIATSWVVPLALFWPIATSADFFGQWNNIFLWSAVALSLCSQNSYLGAKEIK